MPVGSLPYDEPEWPEQSQITVSTVEELMATQSSTKPGNIEVLIEDGTYQVTGRLWITGDNVTYRSKSGNRDGVILKGKGMSGSIGWIFGVAGKHFTLQDVTVGDVYYHGIQVHGELDADYLRVKNVRFYDIRQQMLKGSYDKNKPNNHADYGIVEDCLFEYTAGQGYYWYCGGIDVHKGEYWIVRNNTFKNIVSPESRLAEGAVHFWSNSRDCIIERNTIINCGRGILYGLDNSPVSGGSIRNNTIHVTRDTGIYLCEADGVDVLYNTVYVDSNYQNAIEYRFSGSKNITITGNLANKKIVARDGGSAEKSDNIENAQSSWFKNAAAGDLHLASAVPEVVDQGPVMTEFTNDIDGDERSGKYDIGAHEF